MKDGCPPSSDSKLHRLLPYLIVAGAVTILFLITMLRCDLYPFGDQSLANSDARDQYLNFYSYFRDLLFSNNDLDYSFSTILGANIRGLYAYYLGSPLYLLFALFPEEQILLALHLIIYLKLLLAGLSFCAWAGYRRKQNPWMRACLSVCYAFIGYSVTFYSLLSWLDAVALLPLVAMGLEKLVRERKVLTYTLSLALTLTSNYYTGFAVCLACVLMYGLLLLVSRQGVRDTLKRTVLPFSLSSLLAGALSAWNLLPAVLSLPEGRMKDLSALFCLTKLNFPFFRFFSRLLTGMTSSDQFFDGLPTVFFGIIPLILVALFFFNPKIRRRYKWVAAAALLVMLLSFYNGFLNILWHGMTINRRFNYRYSFLFSFFALAIAWHSVRHWRSLPFRAYGYCFVLVFTGAMLVFFTAYDNENTAVFYVDLLLIASGLILLLFAARGRRAAAGMLGCLMMLNCLLNTILSVCNIRQGFEAATQSEKTVFLSEVRAGLDQIPQEDAFYRIEKTFHQTRCDNMSLRIPGVSNFSSVEREPSMDFTWKLGLNRYIAWSRFTGENPAASDCLLGIRYLLDQDGLYPGREDDTLLGTTNGGTAVYRNPYALPVVMTASSLLPTVETDDGFRFQNACWQSLRTSIGTDIFIQATHIDTQSDDAGLLYLTYCAPKTGAAFLHLPGAYQTGSWPFTAALYRESSRFPSTLPINAYQSTYALGRLEQGETITLAVRFSSEDTAKTIDDFLVYVEDSDMLKTYCETILGSPMEIRKITSSHLEIRCSVGEDTPYLVSTIPYDEGWAVSVDGKAVPVTQNWGAMLAFPVDPGEHTIELRYHAPGKRAGLLISLFSAGIVTGYAVLDAIQRKKRTAQHRKELP